jgi:hypothetical protein
MYLVAHNARITYDDMSTPSMHTFADPCKLSHVVLGEMVVHVVLLDVQPVRGRLEAGRQCAQNKNQLPLRVTGRLIKEGRTVCRAGAGAMPRPEACMSPYLTVSICFTLYNRDRG